MQDKPEIAPNEVRAIRERLGLSQVEAGELIGGGPSAFTKYEAGAVKPAASVIHLLRLLEANPGVMPTLKGHISPSTAIGAISPFEVTGTDIASLTERTFPRLLRRLLNAEAEANGLPAYGVHVASNINAPDGGEDGRITWNDGPSGTPFLPSRLNQFQLKTGKILPAAAGKDVLTKKGAVKDMVRSILEDGGHYIMLCAHPYAEQDIEVRETRIRKALRNAGMTVSDEQVDFRDADQIATWVNRHPPIATWVKEQTQPGTIGPFRSWSHWMGRTEHNQSPWVEDERLPALRAHLREKVTEPRKFVRVVGLSGIGKSRLTLEALRATEEDEAAGPFLSDIVMYAAQSEVGAETINSVVQNLADSGTRAIVVADDCDAETHRILVGMVSRQSSRLSLVTIDYEIPSGTLDENTLKVAEASSSVTGAIIDHVFPGLPSEDQRRLAHFSTGFPEVAIRIGAAWGKSIPIAHATDDTLVDAFVLGRRRRDPELLLKSAALLAASGLVGVERPGGQLALVPPAHDHLSEIASLGRSLTYHDLRFAINQFVNRGVVKRRGRLAVLQPRPIAMKLAERQWEEWSPNLWDEVLADSASRHLKTQAARQLALLNTTGISQEVVRHVCRPGGPFDGFDGICKAGHAEVLSALAEINSAVVADQIERSLGGIEYLTEVRDDVRHHLVWALEKIAFHPHTFEDGARLLLRLAAADNETGDNHATGRFKALFPILLGGTAADGTARLSFLDEVASTEDSAQRAIVAEALLSGSKTHSFSRTLGAEIQGSRPALDPWHPATSNEAADYIEGGVTRLAQLAMQDNEAGVTARTGLGQALRALVLEGFIDTVETVTHQVDAATGYWPEAVNSLRMVLAYDTENINPEVTDRVRALVAVLQPKSLESRIRSLVTELSWDYLEDEEPNIEKRFQRQVEEVRELASELLTQPVILSGALPELSRGQQRIAYVFGAAIAELHDSPLEWLEPVTQAVVGVPEHERNYDLLSGFVTGLKINHPDAIDAFKRRAAQSRELAPALPHVCWRLGIITASDIQLVIGSLQAGVLPPWPLNQWPHGGVLAEVPAPTVAPLFDTLFDHSAEAFAVAVGLMDMYTHRAPEKFEALRPQVLKLAENATRWTQMAGLQDYQFELIMRRMLSKGRQDTDACATALALAKALTNINEFNDGLLMKPVVNQLLSSFPEIAWPLIGQAIVSDKQRALSLEFILGNPFSFGREPHPLILSLPENTLFAWCHAHPASAPAFAAKIVPVLAAPQDSASGWSLHPVTARLLDEFGERDDVRQAIDRNIHTFSWMGSMTTYFAPYKEPLSRLLNHAKPEVRRWAKTMLRGIDNAVTNAHNMDEEDKARWEVQ